MLAMDLSQLQPIAIAVLVAWFLSRILKLKRVPRPRELVRDESSEIDLEFDIESRVRAIVPSVAMDDVLAANAALETKMALLQQLLVAADHEVDALASLLEEARSLRATAVLRPANEWETTEDDVDGASPDAEILPLSNQVAEAETGTPYISPVSQRRFVKLLHASGFSADEVAKIAQIPINIVLGMLGQSGDQDRAAS